MAYLEDLIIPHYIDVESEKNRWSWLLRALDLCLHSRELENAVKYVRVIFKPFKKVTFNRPWSFPIQGQIFTHAKIQEGKGEEQVAQVLFMGVLSIATKQAASYWQHQAECAMSWHHAGRGKWWADTDCGDLVLKEVWIRWRDPNLCKL